MRCFERNRGVDKVAYDLWTGFLITNRYFATLYSADSVFSSSSILHLGSIRAGKGLNFVWKGNEPPLRFTSLMKCFVNHLPNWRSKEPDNELVQLSWDENAVSDASSQAAPAVPSFLNRRLIIRKWFDPHEQPGRRKRVHTICSRRTHNGYGLMKFHSIWSIPTDRRWYSEMQLRMDCCSCTSGLGWCLGGGHLCVRGGGKRNISGKCLAQHWRWSFSRSVSVTSQSQIMMM